MANLHITEIHELAIDPSGARPQIPKLPAVVERVLAIGATSAAGVAFSAATNFVCLTPKADCHIVIGEDPTADTNKLPLSSGQAYYFGVTPGHKVAVIAA